eukprot:NODE_1399_length_1552_cov_20.471058_g1260_i0.p1 GENE.NODE_1399_length_1552_cov_20.471058_g1260_i0~~NODE_1399_length_1552_cov_20.471058_g1260_i0.p1  ORF type:complete len:184 (-),score=25.40 NODE_1399_length_1552_cov_20.471058_g1260_i0:811-1362(-)
MTSHSSSSSFAKEEARVKSFRMWPHRFSKNLTPRKLSQAGFYHNPTPEHLDRCTCFLCGTSLVSWDPTDIPIEEHQKHARHCEFVRRSSLGLQAGRSKEAAREHLRIAPTDQHQKHQNQHHSWPDTPAQSGRDSADTTNPQPGYADSENSSMLRGHVVRQLLLPDFSTGNSDSWNCRDIPLSM